MKRDIGSKLWFHTDGEPQEVIISSHGYRDRDNPKTFCLRNGFLYGTTLYFMVDDGDPSGQRLPQVLEGKGRRDLEHSTEKRPYVYDYYLQKFQTSSRQGGNRHTPDAQESYSIIAQQIDGQSQRIAPGPLHDRRQKDIAKYGQDGPLGGGDFVNRGVITIRSGGPFSKQKVLLSEVIRAAQTPPLRYTTFWCLFCRSIA